MAATFVVEDGNGLPNANAYVTLVYANDYFASRGNAAWAAAADVDKQAAIVRATDYIETVWGEKFLGQKAFVTGDVATDQALSFPRDTRAVFVGNTTYTDTQYVYSSSFVGTALTKPVTIPANLLKATCEYALRALTAALLLDPTVDASGAMVTMKTETVGPISETTQYYATGGVEVTQPYPAADLLLRPLCLSGGRTIRG
jgi:hypothetical protein